MYAFSMHPTTDLPKLLCQQHVLYLLAIALKSQGLYCYSYHSFTVGDTSDLRVRSIPTTQSEAAEKCSKVKEHI